MTHRLILATALCAVLLSPALAQDPPEPADFDTDVQNAYARLPDGEHENRTWEDGEAAFLELVNRYPTIGEAYYHLACVYARWAKSLEGAERERRLAQAFQRLYEAVDLGWQDREWMERDTDMELVRQHEDYPALLQAIREQITGPESIDRAEPLTMQHRLPGDADDGPTALLVYLHEDGANLDSAQEAWARLCDEQEWAWLGIQAPRSIVNQNGYERYGWDAQGGLRFRVLRTLRDALAEDWAEDIPEGAVILAGYRQGAYQALHAALEQPSWFSDVLLLNGPLDRATFSPQALAAARDALRIYAISSTADTLGHDACRETIERFYRTHIHLNVAFVSATAGPELLPHLGAYLGDFAQWRLRGGTVPPALRDGRGGEPSDDSDGSE